MPKESLDRAKLGRRNKVVSVTCRRDKEGEGERISRLNAPSLPRWGKAKRELGGLTGAGCPGWGGQCNKAPWVQTWVWGFVRGNIHGVTTCELQGLDVFRFSLLKRKTWFSWEQWYLRDQYSGGFQATKNRRQQLLCLWNSSLCRQCQI